MPVVPACWNPTVPRAQRKESLSGLEGTDNFACVYSAHVTCCLEVKTGSFWVQGHIVRGDQRECWAGCWKQGWGKLLGRPPGTQRRLWPEGCLPTSLPRKGSLPAPGLGEPTSHQRTAYLWKALLFLSQDRENLGDPHVTPLLVSV